MAQKIFLKMRHRGQGISDNRTITIGYITDIDDTNTLSLYTLTNTSYLNVYTQLKTAYSENYGLTSIDDESGTDLSAFIGDYLNVGDIIDFYDMNNNKLGITMRFEKNDYHVGDSNATHVFSFWSDKYDIGFMAYFDPTDGIMLNVNKVYTAYEYSDIHGLMNAIDSYIEDHADVYRKYSLAHPRLLPIVAMSKIHSADLQYLKNVTEGVDYTNAKFLCIYSGKYPASEIFWDTNNDNICKRVSALNGLYVHGLSTRYNFYEFVEGKAKVTTEYILDEDDNKIQLTKVFDNSIGHQAYGYDGYIFRDFQIGTALKSCNLKTGADIELDVEVESQNNLGSCAIHFNNAEMYAETWSRNSNSLTPVWSPKYWLDQTFREAVVESMPIEIFSSIDVYRAFGNGSSVYLIINPDYNTGIADGLENVETISSREDFPIYLGQLDSYGYGCYNNLFGANDSIPFEHVSYQFRGSSILGQLYVREDSSYWTGLDNPQTWIDMFGITHPEDPPVEDFPKHPAWSGEEGGHGNFDDIGDNLPIESLSNGISYVSTNVEPPATRSATLDVSLVTRGVGQKEGNPDVYFDDFGALVLLRQFLNQKSVSDRSSYTNAIVSLKMFCTPEDFTVLNNEEKHLKLLGEDISAESTTDPATTNTALGCPLAQYHRFAFGSIEIPKFFDSFLDYAPYTQIKLYLPFIGNVDLDPNKVVGKRVHLYANVDAFSGDVVYSIIVDSENVIYQHHGNCSYDIPLSSIDYSGKYKKLIGSIGAIAGGFASVAVLPSVSAKIGGIGAIATGAVGVADAVNSPPSVVGGTSASAENGVMSYRTPYITITRPDMSLPSNYQHTYGYPCNITKRLGDLTGFTAVSDLHLDGIPATKAELDEIESLLKSGVVIK